MSDWKVSAVEASRKRLIEHERARKITDAADGRMRTRTAKEQLAATLAALSGPDEIPLPDADDSSIRTVMR